MFDVLEKSEMILLNGYSCDDPLGSYTFDSTVGSSIIDEVWCSYSGLWFLIDFKAYPIVTCSDHFPICDCFDTQTPLLHICNN